MPAYERLAQAHKAGQLPNGRGTAGQTLNHPVAIHVGEGLVGVAKLS